MVAITVPWFIVLSLTPAHPWVRVSGAALAAIAACGWILNRISGVSNVVERLMTAVTAFAPLGVLVLAGIAVPAYFYSLFTERQLTARTNCVAEGEPN